MKYVPYYKKRVLLVVDSSDLVNDIIQDLRNRYGFFNLCTAWMDEQNIKYVIHRDIEKDKDTFEFFNENDRVLFLLRWG